MTQQQSSDAPVKTSVRRKMLTPKRIELSNEIARQQVCYNVLRREKYLFAGMFPDPDPDNKYGDPEAKNYPLVNPLPYGFDFITEDEAYIYIHLGGHFDGDPRMRAICYNHHVTFSVVSNMEVFPNTYRGYCSTLRYFSVEGRGTAELLIHQEGANPEETAEKYATENAELRYGMTVLLRQQAVVMGNEGPGYEWNLPIDQLKRVVLLKVRVKEWRDVDHGYNSRPKEWGGKASNPLECKTEFEKK